jgi:fermentation-respiration switch protein FrsA (DUF1100 family)
MPRDPSFAGIIQAAHLDLPTLFIHGTADELLPLERSLELQMACEPGSFTLVTHPGAHFVPTCTGQVKQQLVSFLDRFRP